MRGKPCKRKVTNKYRIVLPPNATTHIPVDYKPLPDDRSFAFTATHPQALHAIVDAKTPQVVLVKNTSQDTIVIPKKTRLGRIEESTDSGYFVGSWAGAMTALAVTAVATGMTATPSGAYSCMTSTPVTGQGQIDPITPVNAEFDLTPEILRIATGTVPTNAYDMTEVPSLGDTSVGNSTITPLTDAVYSLIEGAQDLPDELFDPLDPDSPRPKIRETHSTLGIKRPEDLPEQKTPEGVSVYAENATFASQLQDMVARHPRLWTDNGTIDIPEDLQMKIPLVEGWQNHKLNARS